MQHCTTTLTALLRHDQMLFEAHGETTSLPESNVQLVTTAQGPLITSLESTSYVLELLFHDE